MMSLRLDLVCSVFNSGRTRTPTIKLVLVVEGMYCRKGEVWMKTRATKSSQSGAVRWHAGGVPAL